LEERVKRLLSIAITAVVCLTAAMRVGTAQGAAAGAAPGVDEAFKAFWAAATPEQAAAAADRVVTSGITADEAVARLKRGKTYDPKAPHGIVALSHQIGDTAFPYTVEVPENYDSTRKYQVRIQLHGGVGRPDAAPRTGGIGALAGAEQIYVLPTAWAGAEWWTDRQLTNLRRILDSVKRTYNVDENRVVLSGVSDGGTSTYYMAMRETTPFAAFLPLNGTLAVLRNRSMRVDGELSPNNLLNKPLFVVNGGRDPLYPAAEIEPVIEHLSKGGVEIKYLPQPEAVHNTAWWPEVKDTYEAFVREHPRKPLPDTLTWESDLTAGTNRAHWLVIDALTPATLDALKMPDLNDFNTGPLPNFGLRVAGTRVVSTSDGSNASIFEFKPGDIIVSINGKAVPSGASALDTLSGFEPNQMLTVAVTRANQPVELRGFFMSAAPGGVAPLFRRAAPTGRVDLVKTGNTVAVKSRGVSAITLLLSPDAFDFSKPVIVTSEGGTLFEGTVTEDLKTMMTWAARDNDRTMLFAAALPVKLTK
jgi:poly(3-hydroxybutyrate) depolymerase